MANVAVGISASKGLGYIGLILGGASAIKNIYVACSSDSNGNCGKVTTRELGGFLGGIGGGTVGGSLAAGGVALLLGVVGVVSAPVLAIATIGAFVAGGTVGGITGSTAGKVSGEVLYEYTSQTVDVIKDLL
ncbi:hypothetical protein [Enterovibrio norvegicus]|nr:hypothetical protein [Enterovibrio norvegicus]